MEMDHAALKAVVTLLIVPTITTRVVVAHILALMEATVMAKAMETTLMDQMLLNLLETATVLLTPQLLLLLLLLLPTTQMVMLAVIVVVEITTTTILAVTEVKMVISKINTLAASKTLIGT
jgi:flagellar biosynthesis protein FlhB